MPSRTAFRATSPLGRGLLAAFVVVLLGAPAATADPVARISPGVIELGKIQEGNQFDRFLTLTNAGDGTLILEDVKTSCGCTAAAVDEVVELGPGESQQIKLTFNSSKMDGVIKKKVTIYTNDPVAGQQSILLTADVHKPVRFVPKYVHLKNVGPKDSFEQAVLLQADRELGLEVREAFILGSPVREGGVVRNPPTELFDLEMGEKRVEDDRDVYEMTVKLRPGSEPQKLAETLFVVTNLTGDRDTLKTSIRGEIVGRLTATPSFAVLRMVDPGEEAVRDVTVVASHGTFSVVSAEIEDSPVEVEVLPEEGGAQTILRLHYVGQEPGVSGVRQLRIQTDDPEQSLIEIPVRFQTRGVRKPDAKASPANTPFSNREPK
jgi:hypothetical protein